jgi:hypothetical protein
MQAGFSYEQARMILEITERRTSDAASAGGALGRTGWTGQLRGVRGRAAPPPPYLQDTHGKHPETAACSPPPARAATPPPLPPPSPPSPPALEAAGTAGSTVQQPHAAARQSPPDGAAAGPGLDAKATGPASRLEDRVAFLEMELLKHSLTLEAALLAAGGAAAIDPAASADAGADAVAAWGGVSAPPAALGAASSGNPLFALELPPSHLAGAKPAGPAQQLDPEVLAIAEALLIRRGMAPPPPGLQVLAAGQDAGLVRAPRAASVPWGAGWHLQQQRAAQGQAAAAGRPLHGTPAAIAAVRQQQTGANGSVAPYGGVYGDGEHVTYEPANGLAMAGTILAVSLGLLPRREKGGRGAAPALKPWRPAGSG